MDVAKTNNKSEAPKGDSCFLVDGGLVCDKLEVDLKVEKKRIEDMTINGLSPEGRLSSYKVVMRTLEKRRDELLAEIDEIRNQWHIDLNDKIAFKAQLSTYKKALQCFGHIVEVTKTALKDDN